jgi:hypothetical protein
MQALGIIIFIGMVAVGLWRTWRFYTRESTPADPANPASPPDISNFAPPTNPSDTPRDNTERP